MLSIFSMRTSVASPPAPARRTQRAWDMQGAWTMGLARAVALFGFVQVWIRCGVAEVATEVFEQAVDGIDGMLWRRAGSNARKAHGAGKDGW